MLSKKGFHLKRNYVVSLVILAAIVFMIWAGVANHHRRKQENERAREMQPALVPEGTPTPAADSDTGDNPYASPLTGKQAPDFTLEDTTGHKVSLASYKGKAVLVNFWATWCGPCKVEIPWFVQFQQQYGPQGLQIIGISEDDLDKDDKAKLAGEKSEIVKFASGMHINYPVLFDGDSISKPYGGVDSLPTSFYIDRSGKVVTSILGLAPRDQIEATIKKILAGGSQ